MANNLSNKVTVTVEELPITPPDTQLLQDFLLAFGKQLQPNSNPTIQ